MEEILNAYYVDNARKLHGVVDRILLKFGGLSDKDTDDFYSLANEVFVDVMNQYDASQPFEALLYTCLARKIKTEITRRNREKRKADSMSIPIDTPVGDDGDTTLGDIIADSFTIEKELFEKRETGCSARMRLYLNRLSSLQREVLRLNIAGYQPDEIKAELQISTKQYTDCNAAIHSYRNVSVLF